MLSSSTWSLVSQIILVVTSQLRREGEIASLCEAQAGTDEMRQEKPGQQRGRVHRQRAGTSAQYTVHRVQYTEQERH